MSKSVEIDPEALYHQVRCPGCGALMSPATTTLSWWDCINSHCESDEQPNFKEDKK